jgi:hypothetical protein
MQNQGSDGDIGQLQRMAGHEFDRSTDLKLRATAAVTCVMSCLWILKAVKLAVCSQNIVLQKLRGKRQRRPAPPTFAYRAAHVFFLHSFKTQPKTPCSKQLLNFPPIRPVAEASPRPAYHHVVPSTLPRSLYTIETSIMARPA